MAGRNRDPTDWAANSQGLHYIGRATTVKFAYGLSMTF